MALVKMLRFEPRGESRELPVRRIDSLAEPGNLGWHQVPRYEPIDDSDARDEDPRLSDGDAIGCCDPAEPSAHGGSGQFQ